MASKQKPKKVEKTERTTLRDGREPQIGEPVETSFDQRTSVAQPFVLKDGTQDNGARDLADQEGASAASPRADDEKPVEKPKDPVK